MAVTTDYRDAFAELALAALARLISEGSLTAIRVGSGEPWRLHFPSICWRKFFRPPISLRPLTKGALGN